THPSSTLPRIHPSSPPLLFLFNHPPPPDIYPLSLHDALPIYPVTSQTSRTSFASGLVGGGDERFDLRRQPIGVRRREVQGFHQRSEEHTSELQSLTNLVCRLLLEKKN